MSKRIILPFFFIFTLFVCMNSVNADTYQFNVDYDEYFTEKFLERLEYIQKEFVDSGFFDEYDNYYIYLFGGDYYIRYGNVEYSYYSFTKNINSNIETGSYFIRTKNDSINYACSFGNKDSSFDEFKNKVDECKRRKTYTISDNAGEISYPIFFKLYLYSSNKTVKKLTYDEAILLNNRFSDTTPANISINGKLVDDIYKSYLDVSVKFPELESEEISYELDENNVYLSKTVKFYFSEFELEKYKYQYSLDLQKFYDLERNELIVDFNSNGKIYFKILDKEGQNSKEYAYEVNDIGERRFGDPSLDISDSEFPNFGDIDKDITLEEESDIGSLIQWFYNNITNKFKIINQIKNIYDSWINWNPRYDSSICYNVGPRLDANGHLIFDEDFCRPDLFFELKIPGQTEKREFKILDFRIVESIRDIAFDWIRAIMYVYTFLKCVKILQRNFNGGGG